MQRLACPGDVTRRKGGPTQLLARSMTLGELDKMIDLYAAEGGPGLIKLSADTWCAFPMNSGARCADQRRGIRYRGVRIWVSRAFEDQVLSRADAMALGHEGFEDLMPSPEKG